MELGGDEILGMVCLQCRVVYAWEALVKVHPDREVNGALPSIFPCFLVLTLGVIC
jgi:hypothetical protein